MKSAGNTPFLKILIIVFEYQQVLSTGFTTLGFVGKPSEIQKQEAQKSRGLESKQEKVPADRAGTNYITSFTTATI